MAPKRKAPEPAPAAAAAAPKKAKALKTLKDKILDLLPKQDKLVGLASIKKILAADYDVEDNKANGTRIAKTLKDLEAEHREDFGRIDRSYHAGEESAAYLAYIAIEEESDEERPAGDGEINCPHCGAINRDRDGSVDSDSTTHGLRFECMECNEWFNEHEVR